MRFSEQLVSLDHAVVLERLGGDEALLQEVAQLFLEEYPALMSEICAAAQDGDARRVERRSGKRPRLVCRNRVSGEEQTTTSLDDLPSPTSPKFVRRRRMKMAHEHFRSDDISPSGSRSTHS